MIVGKNEMSHCSWHLQLREIFILGGKLAIMAMDSFKPSLAATTFLLQRSEKQNDFKKTKN